MAEKAISSAALTELESASGMTLAIMGGMSRWSFWAHVALRLRIALALLLGTIPAQAASQAVLYGWLVVDWGDAPGESVVALSLHTQEGEMVSLRLDDAQLGALPALRNRLVMVQGEWQGGAGLFAPADGGEFLATSIQPFSGGEQTFSLSAGAPLESDATTDVLGSKPWVTLLCKFSDVAAEPKPASYFQGMYSSSYPGLDHYWREQSYDLANIAGSASVARWYALPQPRSYYVYNMDSDPELEFDRTRAINDCTAATNPDVYFPSFIGINMMFNADLDGYAWGGSRYLTLDGVTRLWNVTWEPPWGYSDLHVIAHEMGHGFGLPHSAWNPAVVYDNRWDVMSDGWTDCNNSRNPTYGCLPQSTIAYHKDRLGWIGSRQVVVSPGALATITLEQLDLPQGGNPLMVRIPIGGSPTNFYTLEARRKVGYDVKLPGQGVIIHKVDTNQSIPALLVDADNNGNTGDAGAVWTPGEIFSDNVNGIQVRVDGSTATGYTVSVSNQAGAIPNPQLTKKLYLALLRTP